MKTHYLTTGDGTKFEITTDVHGLHVALERDGVPPGSVSVDSFELETSVLVFHGTDEEHTERVYFTKKEVK